MSGRVWIVAQILYFLYAAGIFFSTATHLAGWLVRQYRNVCQDIYRKTNKNANPKELSEPSNKQKNLLSFAISLIPSLTRSLLSMRFRVPADGTDRHKYGHCIL